MCNTVQVLQTLAVIPLMIFFLGFPLGGQRSTNFGAAAGLSSGVVFSLFQRGRG